MSFSGLKSSYAKSARANEKSHTVLKDVWAHVNPMAGLLVSQAGLVSASSEKLIFATSGATHFSFQIELGWDRCIGCFQTGPGHRDL